MKSQAYAELVAEGPDSERVIRDLAEKGYSEEFGARNVARLVQDKVKSFFVDAVLFGDLAAGGRAVVDVEGEQVVIRTEAAAPAGPAAPAAPPQS